MVETLPCENHQGLWSDVLRRNRLGINIDKDKVVKTPAKVLDAPLDAWSNGYDEYIPIVEAPVITGSNYGLDETKPNVVLDKKRKGEAPKIRAVERSDDTTEARRIELENFFARIKDMLYSVDLTFEKE